MTDAEMWFTGVAIVIGLVAGLVGLGAMQMISMIWGADDDS